MKILHIATLAALATFYALPSAAQNLVAELDTVACQDETIIKNLLAAIGRQDQEARNAGSLIARMSPGCEFIAKGDRVYRDNALSGIFSGVSEVHIQGKFATYYVIGPLFAESDDEPTPEHSQLESVPLAGYVDYEVLNVKEYFLNTIKRANYSVTVPADIKQAEVEPTLRKIIQDVTAENPDTDEIIVFMFSSAEVSKGAYDIGRAIWSVNGEWGSVTPERALWDARSNYKIEIDVKPDVEGFLAQRAKKEDKFGFSEEARREIYREIVNANYRAQENADRKYPPLTGVVMENAEYKDELLEKYKQELRQKYGYSEDQGLQIRVEAMEENWPRPPMPGGE